MNTNYKKTKELLVGTANSNEINQLIVEGKNTIARVSAFELLGARWIQFEVEQSYYLHMCQGFFSNIFHRTVKEMLY
jgi:hypothetical protein